MNARVFWLTAIAGVLLSIYVFLGSTIPLGISGEWEWPREKFSLEEGVNLLLIGLVVTLPVSLGWWGFVRWGANRIETSSQRGSLLLALMLVGSWLLLNVFQMLPGQTAFPKSWVLYYPNMSGYYHLARYEIDSTEHFLETYEERMAEGDVLHIGTHPPGLFLVNRAFWNFCHSSPALSDAINRLMSQSTQDQFEQLEQSQRAAGNIVTEADRAAIWLSMLLTGFVAVGTILPLFLLMCRFVSRETAWLTAAFWPLIPALSIFLPKSDTLFPCLAVWFLYLWVSAEETRSFGRAVLAGVVFWCGSLLSLAIVPIGLMAGLSSLAKCFNKSLLSSEIPEGGWRAMFSTVGFSLGAFLTLTIALRFAYDINLFGVWLWNYRNHAAFYDQFTRTYSQWLWVNPVETFFAVGAPLTVAALFGGISTLRSGRSAPHLLWACTLVWAILWISGKNSGEAARLWLVFYPVICLWAAVFLESIPGEDRRRQKVALSLLGLQLVVCVVTASSVRGFFI